LRGCTAGKGATVLKGIFLKLTTLVQGFKTQAVCLEKTVYALNEWIVGRKDI
jgi:hypothetical protein